MGCSARDWRNGGSKLDSVQPFSARNSGILGRTEPWQIQYAKDTGTRLSPESSPGPKAVVVPTIRATPLNLNSCASRADSYFMRDRRFDVRWTIEESVDLKWQDASGAAVNGTGMMQDLSASGARIRVSHSIPVQSLLAVSFNGKEVRATVRYCVRKHGEFVAGLEFLPEYQGILRPPRKTRDTQAPVRA